LALTRGLWAPQPGPQTDAICADWCAELLYGGAAGGGKSDFLLGDFLQDVETYGQAWRGILFRRSLPELEEMIARSQEIFAGSGGTWLEQKKRWEWSNGAALRMRYLEADRDATRYQGAAYTWIGWDELGQHPTPFGYKYLRARLRSAHNVPTKRIRCSANPGGVGHHWIKDKFVDPFPKGQVPFQDPDTGGDVMFVPSRLTDNAILMRNDPGYVGRLKGLGSPALVKAWLEGDWNVIAGAFFPEFGQQHIVRAHTIPADWTRFRAADWGSAKPFCVGWYAISDGSMPAYPRGALVKYREWYGSTGEPNKGLKLTAEEVGKGIVEREDDDEVFQYGVIDPAAHARDGGPSIAERIYIGSGRRVPLRAADNARVGKRGAMGGWDQVRARLKGDDGRPMIYFFDNCRDTIRTLPALPHDDVRPEDVDTDAEDHAPDETRYACMSRPWLPPVQIDEPTIYPVPIIPGQTNLKFADLVKKNTQRRMGGRL
jgi:hypothetical protein